MNEVSNLSSTRRYSSWIPRARFVDSSRRAAEAQAGSRLTMFPTQVKPLVRPSATPGEPWSLEVRRAWDGVGEDGT